jgi:type II secretory pathway pseudopilin PulG
MCQMQQSSTNKFLRLNNRSGLTILEIIIVIALMAGIMVYALPQINNAANDYITKVNLFSASVKNAFDTSVLTRRPYRLALDLKTGEYWLETTNDVNTKYSTDTTGRDLSGEELKARREQFDAEFEEYVELAGSPVTDPDSDTPILPDSPVVKAKNKLKLPIWTVVESLEWQTRSIGPDLAFYIVQAEHHLDPINAFEEEEGAIAHIYFSPSGYVEKAFVIIRPITSDGSPVEEEEPFTIETKPFEGIAQVIDGQKEIKFDSEF